MKNRIKRDGVLIKTCVLVWIVLPVLLLFNSVSPAEASNSTVIQENTGTGLEQNKLIDSEIQTPKNTETDLEHKVDSENSVNNQDNPGTNLDPKSEDNSGAEKSESGSSSLVEKLSENIIKESSRSEVVNQEINPEADTSTDIPKNTVSTSDQEMGAGSDSLKSSDQNELSLEQKTTVKSDTDVAESIGLCLNQKTGADTSKETKCSGNQGVIAEPKTGIEPCNGIKSSISKGEKPIPETNRAACSKSKVLLCGAQKERSSSSTTTPQKDDSNLDSSSVNTGFDSNNINSGSDSSSTNSGSDSSSTGFGSFSSSTGYGNAHLIESKALSTQGSERPGPIVDTAKVLGIKDIQPQIKGNVVQASMMSGPSKTVSFLIGFAGMLLILFTILRVKN